jgi:hypothetical protein
MPSGRAPGCRKVTRLQVSIAEKAAAANATIATVAGQVMIGFIRISRR